MDPCAEESTHDSTTTTMKDAHQVSFVHANLCQPCGARVQLSLLELCHQSHSQPVRHKPICYDLVAVQVGQLEPGSGDSTIDSTITEEI